MAKKAPIKPSKPSTGLKKRKPRIIKPFPKTKEARSSKGKHKYRKGSYVKRS
tara:strand:+ start:383 stop:538 length:156 start_codon:yes stop_codon:yes gene_type:complete